MYLLVLKCGGVKVLVYKYGICDINTIVSMKLSFTVAEMSHITIFSNTFTPHLIDSKYFVNPTFHLVSTILDRYFFKEI